MPSALKPVPHEGELPFPHIDMKFTNAGSSSGKSELGSAKPVE